MFTTNKRQQPRGASRTEPRKAAPRWRMGQSSAWLRGLKVVMLVAVVVGVSGYSWQVLNATLQAQVARVVVEGELKHLPRDEVSAELAPFLAKGFWQLDLVGMQQALETLPWVHRAVIRREWPDQLHIEVVEQLPIARWQERGLLNQRGELFSPASSEQFAQLPKLVGPISAAPLMMERYRDFSELFQPQGLALSELQLSGEGNWSLRFDDGIALNLGQRDILLRAQRFLSVYQQQLRDERVRIASVDLRYPNGLAVAWRTQDNG